MKETLAIKGGRVVPVTGEKIENGTVLIKDGKIIAIGGSELEIPGDARVIDASGKWVTPGFIDAHTHLSVWNDISDMDGRMDLNEMTNPLTPQLRALDALNPDDNGIALARKAGFTSCYTQPGSANVICGTGISFKLKKASTIFDIIFPGSEQMKMALGENPRGVYGSSQKFPSTRMGVAAVLRGALFNAKAYSDALYKAEKDPEKAQKPDFMLEALVPVIRGEMKCRIHCHRADDIVTAVRISEEFGLDFSVEHCTEGYKILDYLKEHSVDCVVGPLVMSRSKEEIWGRRLETPAEMEEKGVNFCLTEDNNGDTQYLPIHVGLAMAHGLSEKAAFESVTIRPAKLLGLSERVGSLEEGKDGDIAIFSSFPFDNMSRCEKTIIDGEVYENL